MAEAMFTYSQSPVTTPDMSGVTATVKEGTFNKGLQDLVGGLFKASSSIAEQAYKEQAIIEANKGKWEAVSFLNANEHLSGTEKVLNINKKKEELTQGKMNNTLSGSYADSFDAVLSQGYVKALDSQYNEYQEASAFQAKTAFQSVLEAGPDVMRAMIKDTSYSNPVEYFVDWFSKEFKTTPKNIQSATLAALYDSGSSAYANIYSDAYDEKGKLKPGVNLDIYANRIAATEQAFNEKEQFFTDSKYYYGSKSPEMVGKITQGKAAMVAAKNYAETQLKVLAGGIVAGAEGDRDSLNSYTIAPTDKNLITAVQVLHENKPLEVKRTLEEYTNGYTENEQAKIFLASNTTDTYHQDPAGLNNKKLTKIWGQTVTNDLSDAISKGQINRTIAIINSNENYLSDARRNIISLYKSATKTEELAPLLDVFDRVASSSQGPSALRSLLQDETYIDMLSSIWVAKTLYNGDLVAGRNYVAKAEGNPQTMQTSEFKQNVIEQAEILGPQFGKFQTIMNKMWQINPKLAIENLDTIAENMADSVEKITVGSTLGFGGSEVWVDKSVTNFFAQKSLDTNTLINSTITAYTDVNDGVPSSITMVGNTNIAVINDKYGGTAQIINMDRTIDKANANYEKRAVESSAYYDKTRGKFGMFIDNMGNIAIGSTVRITEGLYNTTGKLLNRFGGYLSKQWDGDVATVYRMFGLNPAKAPKEDKEAVEITLLLKEQEIENNIKKGQGFKNTGTMSKNGSTSLAESLVGEQRKLQDLKKLNDKIRMTSILNYEGGYSSDRKDVGNYLTPEDYANGRNFVGTKYGVSATALSNYLGRPASANEMKNLSQSTATKIIEVNYLERYKIKDLPPQIQKVALHAYMLSPANADKALKMGGVSSADFSRNFIKQLKKNTGNYNIYGKSWEKRFNSIGVE